MKIQIKSFFGSVLFEYDSENNSIRKTIVEAVKKGADLRGADLRGQDLEGANLRSANLRGADLREANLRDANLKGANLRDANLRYADLRYANLRYADLRGANLEPYKNDMHLILLRAIPELDNLKKAIKEGRIDGSTYEGACACLCGTIEKTKNEELRKTIVDLRDCERPIEMFFGGINRGDTPENSEFSRLALEWIKEFERLISNK